MKGLEGLLGYVRQRKSYFENQLKLREYSCQGYPFQIFLYEINKETYEQWCSWEQQLEEVIHAKSTVSLSDWRSQDHRGEV